jgi:hypothetical protein
VGFHEDYMKMCRTSGGERMIKRERSIGWHRIF